MPDTPAPLPQDDVAAIGALHDSYQRLRQELAKAIIGQEQVIEKILICILARGHADVVAIGKPLIANPDLVERFRRHAELNRWDTATFYASGSGGYTDYPAL